MSVKKNPAPYVVLTSVVWRWLKRIETTSVVKLRYTNKIELKIELKKTNTVVMPTAASERLGVVI